MAYRKKTGHTALVVTHHDGPGDHFADHRLAFGLFRRRLTLGPTSPLQLTLLQDLPRAPLGDYRQGYLSSCRLKATICLLGDTLLGFLSPSGSLPRTPLGLEDTP